MEAAEPTIDVQVNYRLQAVRRSEIGVYVLSVPAPLDPAVLSSVQEKLRREEPGSVILILPCEASFEGMSTEELNKIKAVVDKVLVVRKLTLVKD